MRGKSAHISQREKYQKKSFSMYLSISVIDYSVNRTGKNCYPRVFLETVNMLLKKKRYLSILLTILLMVLMKKILMKETLRIEV